MTRLILIDHDTLLRDGLEALFRRQDNMEVVATASAGWGAQDLITQHQPQVLVLGVEKPGSQCYDQLQKLKRDHPELRLLVMTEHCSEQQIHSLLEAGAVGVVPKQAGFEVLLQAIETGRRDEPFVPEKANHDSSIEQIELDPSFRHKSVYETLTARERQVLSLVAEGLTTKAVAKSLHLSPKTVDSHRQRIMRRLNVHNVAKLVQIAVRDGLVSVEC